MDPKTDLNIVQNIDFGSTAAAFSEGQADYTVEFEPGATSLETGRKGYVVASLGTDSGYVPYTAFSARKSYISEHSDTIQGFVNALQKGMDYVQTHSPEEIAKIIEPQFPETDLSLIHIFQTVNVCHQCDFFQKSAKCRFFILIQTGFFINRNLASKLVDIFNSCL